MVAGQIGTMRLVSSRKKGLIDQVDAKVGIKLDWTTDFDAAAAEMAYAKYRNVYYDPTVNTFKAPDVAKDQVRSTLHLGGNLILRGKDIAEERYILVICSSPVYRMAGWIWASEAKQEKWLQPKYGKNIWWVPQEDLHPMETLDD